MSKKRKNRGRKSRALRTCACLLVIVVLASALKLYCFLPVQAIHAIADRQDVEDPQVVARFYDGALPVTRTALHYLVDGDRSMMLCVTGFNVFMGWYDRSYVPLETWDDSGIHAGLYMHQQDEQRVAYLFGKIEDASVARLALDGFSVPTGEEGVSYHAEIPVEDIFDKDGERYFVSKLDEADLPEYLYEGVVIGYDRNGTAVETAEALVHTWST